MIHELLISAMAAAMGFSWWNPLNWPRNIQTKIGECIIGKGTKFNINLYGEAKLKPIFPNLK